MTMKLPERALDWLNATQFGNWRVTPMAGDASTRQYARLVSRDGAQTAIFMMCAPDQVATCQAFVRIAKHLNAHGLKTPEIYLDGADQGLLITEDLGQTSVNAWLNSEPDDEPEIYNAISDVLLTLQNVAPLEDMARMTPQVAVQMLDPYFEFASLGSAQENARAAHTLSEVFSTELSDEMAFSSRDFMSENLIWRPDQTGLARVGVIDFQDAIVAPYIYDLVSVAEDARRDVSPSVRSSMIAQFADAKGYTEAKVAQDAAIISLQRNLRIIGIFARLSKIEGRHGYQQFVPRVAGFINQALAHPVFGPTRNAIEKTLP